MRLLLDTHALLWWLVGARELSRRAREAIGDGDNQIFVSAVSAWEVTTKFRIGKLPRADALASDFTGVIADQGFAELPISMAHAQSAGALGGPIRDPFDRMLIAQALIEAIPLVSNERIFDRYEVKRIW